MSVVAIDFETYYDTEYSLRKMPTQQYIQDPRFQIIGFSYVASDMDDTPKSVPGYDVASMRLALLSLTARYPVWVAHNGFFDFGILSLVFGIHPKLMSDTRMLGNAIDGSKGSASLAALAKLHSLPEKGDTVVAMKGRRLEDLSLDEFKVYMDYCAHDAWLCYKLFQLYKPKLANKEHKTIHRVLELFTKPKLLIDQAPLDEAVKEEAKAQEAALESLGGFKKSMIISNPKFASALTMLGVRPPTKLSPRTRKPTYAFAKTDLEFLALRDHESPGVRALVEARLVLKSSIMRTRAERLKKLAPLGPMCVPLVYYAAHTGRLGGSDSLNLQNLPRGSKLRQALVAPPGHKIVVADSSQIEARLTAWFCGERSVLSSYARGEDVYCQLASQIFRKDITKEDNPTERFVGKVGELSLQYGVAERTFETMLRTSGVDLSGLPLSAISKAAVATYRGARINTINMWLRLKRIIEDVLSRPVGRATIRGVEFRFEKVVLPDCKKLVFPSLERRAGEFVSGDRVVQSYDWSYFYRNGLHRIHGPKLLENIIQALAWAVLSDYWLRLAERYHIVLQVHDELVAVVPDDQVPQAVADFTQEFKTPPLWAPSLPVDCEVAVGQSYLEAK